MQTSRPHPYTTASESLEEQSENQDFNKAPSTVISNKSNFVCCFHSENKISHNEHCAKG